MSKGKTKTKISYLESMWHHIRRSPFQSFLAVLVMWLNFLVAGILVVLVLGLGNLLNYFETRPEVTAFLKDTTTQVQIEELKKNINKISGVKEIRFVSKEDALSIYKEQNKDNPLLLEMVKADILPASLEIAAESPDILEKVAGRLEEKSGLIEEVVFQEDVVKKLSFWVKVIRNIGIGTVGFLSLVSFLVIMIILAMKVSSHRDEIRVLRSLGASSFYIQAPFLLEGMFYGFWGVVLGSSVVIGLLYFFREKITGFFGSIQVISTNINLILGILGVEIFIGICLGVFAAWTATRRFIKK